VLVAGYASIDVAYRASAPPQALATSDRPNSPSPWLWPTAWVSAAGLRSCWWVGAGAAGAGAAGGVGTALLQLGGLQGLEMYGTASAGKHDLVSGLGATPIDYKAEDFVERVRALSGEGVDAVFDVAGKGPLEDSIALRGGTERIVSYVTEELVEQGHDVTLFASGDSLTKADLAYVYQQAPSELIGRSIPPAAIGRPYEKQ
jgi:NADPH:quinone reductase-like Zn-dependent oxidoreductase